MERKVTFTLQESEIVKIVKSESLKGFFNIRFPVMLIFFLIVGLLFAFRNNMNALMNPDVLYFIFKQLIFIFLPLIIFWFSFKFLLLQRQSKFLARNNCDIGNEETAIWDEETISLHSKWLKWDYPWHVLYRVSETADAIIFCPSPVMGGAIPKRALSNEQLQDLQTIIRRYSNKPKKR